VRHTKKAFANQADLVLDLTLLPPRRRRASDRFDEMMRAHLEKAAIVLPVLADEASNTIPCISRG
jgi:hypothetical protein